MSSQFGTKRVGVFAVVLTLVAFFLVSRHRNQSHEEYEWLDGGDSDLRELYMHSKTLEDADIRAQYVMPAFCSSIARPQTEYLCSVMANAPVKEVIGKKLRIMAVGDSVTAGPLGTSSYRGDLIKLVHDQNEIEMVGNAYWGNLVPLERNRLEAGFGKQIANLTDDLLTSLPHWQPNLILLHAGTNNMIDNKHLEQCPVQMAKMIDLIFTKCPNCVLIVALIIPCGFRLEQVNTFNKALLDLVAHFSSVGRHILAADMNVDWEFSKLMDDVAHPNAKGYTEMARRWHMAIQQANGLGWLLDGGNPDNHLETSMKTARL